MQQSTVSAAAALVNKTLLPLDLKYQYRPGICTGIGFAKENVWSRAARRSKKRQVAEAVAELVQDFDFGAMEVEGRGKQRRRDNEESSEGEVEDDEGEDNVKLGFKIEIRQGEEEGEVLVQVRWLRGLDAVLWESFCGMLRRGVTS